MPDIHYLRMVAKNLLDLDSGSGEGLAIQAVIDEVYRLQAFAADLARLPMDGENGFEADPTYSAATLDKLIAEARRLMSPQSTEQ